MKAEKSEQTSESESVGGLQRCMDNFKKKSLELLYLHLYIILGDQRVFSSRQFMSLKSSINYDHG